MAGPLLTQLLCELSGAETKALYTRSLSYARWYVRNGVRVLNNGQFSRIVLSGGDKSAKACEEFAHAAWANILSGKGQYEEKPQDGNLENLVKRGIRLTLLDLNKKSQAVGRKYEQGHYVEIADAIDMEKPLEGEENDDPSVIITGVPRPRPDQQVIALNLRDQAQAKVEALALKGRYGEAMTRYMNEIQAYAAMGLDEKEIAGRLGIAEPHLRKLRERLGSALVRENIVDSDVLKTWRKSQ